MCKKIPAAGLGVLTLASVAMVWAGPSAPLTRETSASCSGGQFEISVDGKSVGPVEYGETVEKPIEPGHHTLQLRVGRYSSREFSFDAEDAGIVSFRCHGAMVWPRYVASLLKPDLAISFKRQ